MIKCSVLSPQFMLKLIQWMKGSSEYVTLKVHGWMLFIKYPRIPLNHHLPLEHMSMQVFCTGGSWSCSTSSLITVFVSLLLVLLLKSSQLVEADDRFLMSRPYYVKCLEIIFLLWLYISILIKLKCIIHQVMFFFIWQKLCSKICIIWQEFSDHQAPCGLHA